MIVTLNTKYSGLNLIVVKKIFKKEFPTFLIDYDALANHLSEIYIRYGIF